MHHEMLNKKCNEFYVATAIKMEKVLKEMKGIEFKIP